MSELRAQELKKRFRSRNVVKDVSLEVSSGEVVGLLGPNGAGKTTCFYMMVGLVPVDGGELQLDGNRLTHMPMHKRARLGLSYLPQEASIFRKLSVGENVEAVLELQDLDAEDVEGKPMTSSTTCTLATSGTTLPLVSQAASGGGWKSRERLLRGRASSCSMNHLQGSTPLRF